MTGAIATRRPASTTRLRMRWATVKYAQMRISQPFSFRDAKMLVNTGELWVLSGEEVDVHCRSQGCESHL